MGENAGLIIGIVVAVVVVLIIVISIVGWYISTLNNFRRMGVKIDEANSGIDVALTKRFDLLTKTIATVKGYAKHEEETLSKIIAMRNPGKGATLQEKQEFANATTQALKSVNLVVEQYPTLKADNMFNNLQRSISEVEENLQAARSNFNANVSAFNKAILQFPASVVAGARFTRKDYFEAEVAKTQDVAMDF